MAAPTEYQKQSTFPPVGPEGLDGTEGFPVIKDGTNKLATTAQLADVLEPILVGPVQGDIDAALAEFAADSAAAIAQVGYQAPVAYAAGIALTSTSQTVDYNGDIYAPIVSALPFTTSGTFETAKFRLIVPGQFLQSGTGAVARTMQDKAREVAVSVKDFGAVGDGVTNDTDAFYKASSAIAAAGGGRLTIPSGTYIVGKQTFAGANGLGYAYRAADIIRIENCVRPVIIESHGAVIKIADGLRFGSFDPVTGLPNSPALPNTNQNYGADVGIIVMLKNNSGGAAIIGSLELDGNNTNLLIGGQWGDVGYQRIAYGVWEYNNAWFYAENVYTHNHGTDGIVCGYTGAVSGGPKRPKTLVNVISEYNARQGLSWVGGNGLTAINCKFNRSGRAINVGTGVALSSSPAAGIDIEAESAVNRNGVFINCESINNGNTALVADSGDSADVRFIQCVFGGTVWPKKPGFKFYGCRIHGVIVNPYGHISPALATSFDDCVITDADIDDYVTPASLGSNIFSSVVSAPVYMTRCTVIATKMRPGRLDNYVMQQCSVEINFPGTSAVNDKDYVALMNNAVIADCKFTSNITVNAPANAYFIGGIDSLKTRGSNTLSNSGSGLVRWFSWSTGAGGFTGELGNTGGQTSAKIGSNAISIFQSNYSTQYAGTIETYAGAAAPTAGTYKRGDRVINQSASAGAPSGWICTAAGTPGTWVPFGYANTELAGSKTYDWPDLPTATQQTTTVTVTGAALGDYAEASMSVDLAGTALRAYVSAADTVTVVQRNDTGANVNLASGTLRVRVRKA